MPQSAVRIAPPFLAADSARPGEEARAAAEAGADRLRLDAMGGRSVPDTTFGPAIVSALRRHRPLSLDVHLLTAPAGSFLGTFAEAGAGAIGLHPEAEPRLRRGPQTARHLGERAGAASNATKVALPRRMTEGRGRPIALEADGGVSPVSGTAVSGAPDYAAAIAALRGGSA